jgi:hypothetical protein
MSVDLATRSPGPTCARHARTDHDVLVDGPRGARTVRRTVRKFFQSLQYYLELPRPVRTVRATPADGPPGQAGRSEPPFSF